MGKPFPGPHHVWSFVAPTCLFNLIPILADLDNSIVSCISNVFGLLNKVKGTFDLFFPKKITNSMFGID